MVNQKLIDKLNDCLKHEWTGVAQYAQAGFVISGLWREVYGEMFMDSAKESFGHAQLMGEKISALGGIPSVERNPVRQSQDLDELLEFAFDFESAAVKLYTEAIHLVEKEGSDRALIIFLEDILKEEQEGVDELVKIRRKQIGEAKKASKSSSKAS